MHTLLRFAAASGLVGLTLMAPVAHAATFAGPQTATGSYLAGQQAITELRTHEAAEFFHDATTEDWNNPLILDRAFIAFAADGQVDAAAETAKRAVELEPDNDLAKLVLATEAFKQRRYDAAIADLDKLDPGTFEGVTGSILKAWAIVGDNRIDDAFGSLDKIGDGGLEEFLVFHRAIMADVAGRQDDAIKYITEAHDADPYTADVVEAYARILADAGQYDKASEAITAFEAQGLASPIITEVKAAIANKQRPGLYAASVQEGAAEMFHSVGVAFAREGTSEISLVLLRTPWGRALYLAGSGPRAADLAGVRTRRVWIGCYAASALLAVIEPQSTGMNGLDALAPLKWIDRATSSLPVPLSPWISTGCVEKATFDRIRYSFSISGERPTMPPIPACVLNRSRSCRLWTFM